jgi:hypothetical protein
MKRLLVLPLLLCALSAPAQEGEWKGPIRLPVWSVDPDGEFVTIVYGLSEAAAKKFDVSLQLANVEQGSLTEPDAVTGHIGTVAPGPVRKIFWHYRKDYPAGLRGKGWKFILTIEWGREKVTVATREGTFTPPHLVLEKVLLTDANGNGILNAGEEARLSFVVRNAGIGDALGTSVRLSLVQPLEGVRFDTLLTSGNMTPGAAIPMQATITGLQGLQTGVARILLRAGDRNEFSIAGDTVAVETQAFQPPALVVTGRFLQTPMDPAPRPLDGGSLLIRGDTSVVTLVLSNRGRGKADSVRAAVWVDGEGWNAYYLGRSRAIPLLDIPVDSAETVWIPLVADERAEAEHVRIFVTVTERSGMCGIADTIRIPVRRRFLTFDAQFADLMRRALYDSARVLCQRRLAIEPYRAGLYVNLGEVYELLGDHPRAVEQYVAAADRGDRRAAAWLQQNATYSENTLVRYESVALPFFAAAGTVTLGVFASPAADDDPSGERLYNTLRSSTDRKKVILIPYRAMTSQLGASSIRSTDSTALKRLGRDLGIAYVVDAREAEKNLQSFTLTVIRTSDGQQVFARKFQQSSVSTALQDVGRLFKESLAPVYTAKRVYSTRTRK